MCAFAPSLQIEVKLLGRVLTTEVVVHGHAVVLELLEPVWTARGTRELRLAARPRRLGVGLEPDERADEGAMRVEPYPDRAAVLGDVGSGSGADDDLHRTDDGTDATKGAADCRPLRTQPAVQAETMPVRSSSVGATTASYGFLRCARK